MSQLRILKTNETFFFSQHAGRLCQWINLALYNPSAETILATATILTGGDKVSTPLQVQPGASEVTVYAPALWPDRPRDEHAMFTLETSQEAVQIEVSVGGHRPWVVYLLADDCTDYTWVYGDEAIMRADDAALTEAEITVTEKMAGASEADRNHYNFVNARQVEYYLERYPQHAGRLFDHIRSGDITLNPIINMTLIGDMSLEAFVRSLYPARRWARQHGLEMAYANIQETPTASWATTTVLAGAGIKHLLRATLPYECPYARRIDDLPIYIWEGPDGSRLLVRLRNRDYVEAHFVLKGLETATKTLHEEIISGYEKRGEAYPFSAIGLAGCYGDLAPNSPELPAVKAAVVAAYNAQGWEYPRLVNASHQQFWNDIDRQIQQRAIDLPVRRGDYGASWEAWPACLAYDFAAWRRAQERAATADRLAAILSQVDRAWFNAHQSRLEEAWWNVIPLADHAWNGANPANLALNIRLRRQWQEQAHQALDEVIDSGMTALSKQAPTGKDDGVMVFNSLGWRRTSLARLPAASVKPGFSPVEAASGKAISSQLVDEAAGAALYFIARDVPSMGYRIYPMQNTAPVNAEDVRTEGNRLESRFYSLEIDPKSGGIARLFDKVRQRELVDPASPYRLNEPVYLSSAGKPAPAPAGYTLFNPINLAGCKEFRPRCISIQPGACGAVFGELKVASEIAVNGIGNIQFTNTIRIYNDLDRIDIRNEVDKPVSTERQELDFVFPFLVPDRRYRFEAPGAIIEPGGDQLPGAGQAVTAVRHFVDIFNDEYGVTLSQTDSGLVEFGHRTTGEDPLAPDPSNSTILALALDNCIDGNEAARDQGGVSHFVFRYSLRSHAGGFDPVEAVRFGWEDNNELLALCLPAGQSGSLPPVSHSFLTVEPANLIITGFKPADGWQDGSPSLILRLWECDGKDAQAIVHCSGLGSLASACQTDLLEADLAPLKTTGNQVSLPVKARGVSAARLAL